MPSHDHSAHQHDHAHHAHARADQGTEAHGRRGRKLLFAFTLTLLMLLVEAVGGIWSGSLALLADAGHMLVDALALLMAYVGVWMGARPADARRSYGYGRMEVLAGFVSALSQFVLVGWIVYEAVTRMLHPGNILSGVMLVVAVAGLLVNLLLLRMLHGHAHDDVNLAAASLHVLGDLLGSVAAVLAAILIRWQGWLWADPLLSVLVSLLILGSAWRLLRLSAHILLEGVPDGLDSAQVLVAVRSSHGAIRNIHHLHVWQLASGSRMATLHAELESGVATAPVLQAIRDVLKDRFSIQHVTVQVDERDCPDAAQPCGGHGHY